MKKLLLPLFMLFVSCSCVFAADINVNINENAVEFGEDKPIIRDGRTLVPLRSVFDELGYAVSWEEESKTAVVESQSVTVRLKPGTTEMQVNDKEIALDTPPIIHNDRTYINLRAVAEATGLKVEWEEESKTATILTNISNDSPVIVNEDPAVSISDAQIKLLNKCIEENKGENVLISPDSIVSAFGMLENGAAGGTLSEMEKVINGGASVDTVNEYISSLNERMHSSKDVSFDFANSVWINDSANVKLTDDFSSKADKYYSAEHYSESFSAETVTKINKWVNDKTHEMINKIINTLSEDARAVLINALAFEAEWAQEYTDNNIIEKSRFTNADGTESECTLLFSEENGYFELDGAKGFKRPYKGGDFSFVGILPPKDTSADEFASRLTGKKFINALSELNYDAEVYCYIPEFKYDYSAELSEMLKSLGMPSAFSGADFSNMVTPDSESLEISAVIHKTHIEVDRKGTKAAAVTGIVLETTAVADFVPPVTIRLDRPFVYAIVDNKTNFPVFIGTVNNL